MKFRPTLAVIGLGLVASGAALSAHAEGDAANGAVLAYTCQGCHGVPNYKNAYPNYSVPRLGGQSAQYLISALKEYATGARPHQTMHSHAATMSDQDRADIAAYLQAEPVQSGNDVVGTPPPETSTCVACHGADGAKTISPEYPVLAGQQADYIVQALKDYKSGKRKNPIMAGIAAGVPDEKFAALGEFFSKQPGLCSTDEIRDHGKCARMK